MNKILRRFFEYGKKKKDFKEDDHFIILSMSSALDVDNVERMCPFYLMNEEEKALVKKMFDRHDNIRERVRIKELKEELEELEKKEKFGDK